MRLIYRAVAALAALLFAALPAVAGIDEVRCDLLGSSCVCDDPLDGATYTGFPDNHGISLTTGGEWGAPGHWFAVDNQSTASANSKQCSVLFQTGATMAESYCGSVPGCKAIAVSTMTNTFPASASIRTGTHYVLRHHGNGATHISMPGLDFDKASGTTVCIRHYRRWAKTAIDGIDSRAPVCLHDKVTDDPDCGNLTAGKPQCADGGLCAASRGTADPTSYTSCETFKYGCPSQCVDADPLCGTGGGHPACVYPPIGTPVQCGSDCFDNDGDGVADEECGEPQQKVTTLGGQVFQGGSPVSPTNWIKVQESIGVKEGETQREGEITGGADTTWQGMGANADDFGNAYTGCRDNWCRFEACLDYGTDGIITVRRRVYQVPPGSGTYLPHHTWGDYAITRGTVPRESWQLRNTNASGVSLFAQLMPDTVDFASHFLVAQTGYDPNFWIGSATEVEGPDNQFRVDTYSVTPTVGNQPQSPDIAWANMANADGSVTVRHDCNGSFTAGGCDDAHGFEVASPDNTSPDNDVCGDLFAGAHTIATCFKDSTNHVVIKYSTVTYSTYGVGGPSGRCTALGAACWCEERLDTETVEINGVSGPQPWPGAHPYGAQYDPYDSGNEGCDPWEQEGGMLGTHYSIYAYGGSALASTSAGSALLPPPYIPGTSPNYVLQQASNTDVKITGKVISGSEGQTYCQRSYQRFDATNSVPTNSGDAEYIQSMGGHAQSGNNALAVSVGISPPGQITAYTDLTDFGSLHTTGNLGNMRECVANWCRFETCLDHLANGHAAVRYKMTVLAPSVPATYTATATPSGTQATVNWMYTADSSSARNENKVMLFGANVATTSRYFAHLLWTKGAIDQTFWPGCDSTIEPGCNDATGDFTAVAGEGRPVYLRGAFRDWLRERLWRHALHPEVVAWAR